MMIALLEPHFYCFPLHMFCYVPQSSFSRLFAFSIVKICYLKWSSWIEIQTHAHISDFMEYQVEPNTDEDFWRYEKRD